MIFFDWIRAKLARQGVGILQAFFVPAKACQSRGVDFVLWFFSASNSVQGLNLFDSVSIEMVKDHNAGLPKGRASRRAPARLGGWKRSAPNLKRGEKPVMAWRCKPALFRLARRLDKGR